MSSLKSKCDKRIPSFGGVHLTMVVFFFCCVSRSSNSNSGGGGGGNSSSSNTGSGGGSHRNHRYSATNSSNDGFEVNYGDREVKEEPREGNANVHHSVEQGDLP